MPKRRDHYLDTSAIVYLAADKYTDNDLQREMHSQTVECIRVARLSEVRVVTSILSDQELADNRKDARRKSRRALRIVQALPHVTIPSGAKKLVNQVIATHNRHYMDFMHYAVAAMHDAEVVLTWNVDDFILAKNELKGVLKRAGFDYPRVMTPSESTNFLLRTSPPPRDNPRRRRRRARR